MSAFKKTGMKKSPNDKRAWGPRYDQGIDMDIHKMSPQNHFMLDPELKLICPCCTASEIVDIMQHWRRTCLDYDAYRRIRNSYFLEAKEKMNDEEPTVFNTHMYRNLMYWNRGLTASAIMSQNGDYRPSKKLIGHSDDPWHGKTTEELMEHAYVLSGTMSRSKLPMNVYEKCHTSIIASNFLDYPGQLKKAIESFMMSHAHEYGYISSDVSKIPKNIQEGIARQVLSEKSKKKDDLKDFVTKSTGLDPSAFAAKLVDPVGILGDDVKTAMLSKFAQQWKNEDSHKSTIPDDVRESVYLDLIHKLDGVDLPRMPKMTCKLTEDLLVELTPIFEAHFSQDYERIPAQIVPLVLERHVPNNIILEQYHKYGDDEDSVVNEGGGEDSDDSEAATLNGAIETGEDKKDEDGKHSVVATGRDDSDNDKGNDVNDDEVGKGQGGSETRSTTHDADIIKNFIAYLEERASNCDKTGEEESGIPPEVTSLVLRYWERVELHLIPNALFELVIKHWTEAQRKDDVANKVPTEVEDLCIEKWDKDPNTMRQEVWYWIMNLKKEIRPPKKRQTHHPTITQEE